jgi:hypothetical protein
MEKVVCTVCEKGYSEDHYTYSKTVCNNCYKKRVRFAHSRDYVENLPSLHVKKDGVYIVTSVLPNVSPVSKAVDCLELLCEDLKATLFCLGTKAHQRPLKDDTLYYPKRLTPYLQRDVTMGDVRVADFRVNPQRINPLTGLDRLVKQHHLGVASPKQYSNPIAVGNDKMRRIFSTGTISKPRYRNTEITGLIAEQNHKIGAVLLRIRDSHCVEFSPLEIIDGELMYAGVIYNHAGEMREANIASIVFGDLHLESHDYEFECAFWKVITEYNPMSVVLHDMISGSSVTHHNINKPLSKPSHSIQKEVDLVSALLCDLQQYDIKVFIPDANHDKHIENYVASGAWVRDDLNRELCVKMLPFLKHDRPLMEFIIDYTLKRYNRDLKDSVTPLKGDCDLFIHGIHISSHGHAHASGRKGHIDLYEKTHGRSIIGHSHSVMWRNNTWSVGKFCPKRLGYNQYSDVSEIAYILVSEEGYRNLVTIVV